MEKIAFGVFRTKWKGFFDWNYGLTHCSHRIANYTRNEWRRFETTLETSEEDVKLHSKRVKKMWNYTRNGLGRCDTTLESSVKISINSKPIKTRKLNRRFILTKSISVLKTLPFRVWFHIFYTRFECSFKSFTLVSSVTTFQSLSEFIKSGLNFSQFFKVVSPNFNSYSSGFSAFNFSISANFHCKDSSFKISIWNF